jgi:hypothetical protein
LYFLEQEKKWIFIINKIKQKISYYKELCKTIIQQEHNYIKKIEDVNDVLFANKVSKENLNAHKKLISELLAVINEKRDQIYLCNSEKDIMERECKFWITDFDKVKLCKITREKIKEINIEKLKKNITEEFSHKK